MEKDAASVRSP